MPIASLRNGMALACLWVLAAGCASTPAPKETVPKATPRKEKQSMVVPEAKMGPEAFAARVAAAGGRVDFVFGDDRPFAECHASTIVQCANGDLIAAWFGGTEEKHPDVGVWMARFTGGAWGAPYRAIKVGEKAHWNPVLFRDAQDTVYLFFKVGVDVPHWQTYWMQSDDNGQTWTEATELVPGDVGGRGPVKNKAIILSDGSWLAPASTELAEYKPAKDDPYDVEWRPFADRSTDRGKTWERSEDWLIDRRVIKGVGGIQPTFWESDAGQVHALMRTGGGCIARTDSSDGGRTWGAVYATSLPNNNSGIDVVQLEDGRLVLIYNPIGRNWGPRTPLYLAISKDDGNTWCDWAALETEPGEYSYPSVVRTKDGIAVCYTWKRERVRCWQVPLAALAP